jgi:hypothetical protein
MGDGGSLPVSGEIPGGELVWMATLDPKIVYGYNTVALNIRVNQAH